MASLFKAYFASHCRTSHNSKFVSRDLIKTSSFDGSSKNGNDFLTRFFKPRLIKKMIVKNDDVIDKKLWFGFVEVFFFKKTNHFYNKFVNEIYKEDLDVIVF